MNASQIIDEMYSNNWTKAVIWVTGSTISVTNRLGTPVVDDFEGTLEDVRTLMATLKAAELTVKAKRR